MKTIYLISCVAKKGDGPAPARDLYVSDWFHKAKSYIETKEEPWFILSAKHGVIEPSVIIEPYNVTLNNMRIAYRRLWARRAIDELKQYIQPGDTIIFLAGYRYREFLIDPIREMGCHIEIPMEGLRIGEQLKWLKRRL